VHLIFTHGVPLPRARSHLIWRGRCPPRRERTLTSQRSAADREWLAGPSVLLAFGMCWRKQRTTTLLQPIGRTKGRHRLVGIALLVVCRQCDPIARQLWSASGTPSSNRLRPSRSGTHGHVWTWAAVHGRRRPAPSSTRVLHRRGRRRLEAGRQRSPEVRVCALRTAPASARSLRELIRCTGSRLLRPQIPAELPESIVDLAIFTRTCA